MSERKYGDIWPFRQYQKWWKLENNTMYTQLPEKGQDFQEKHKAPESVNTHNALISKLLRKKFKNLETCIF